jgi:transcriptional regulator with XRE-family HTH domain
MSKIDEQTRIHIENSLRRKNGLSKVKIAEKYGVSYNTVSRVEESIGLRGERKHSRKIAKDETNTQENQSIENEPTVIDASLSRIDLEVGLIADRHNMPVNKYVFSRAMDSKSMFDYGFMDSVVSKFLLENMYDDSGKVNKNLILYTTGLTSATSSVIKMCSQMGINLTIKHFNTDTRDYESQIVFRDYGKDPITATFPCANDKIYFYDGIDTDYINKAYRGDDVLFVVKDINKDDSIVSIHVFKNMDKAKEIFLTLAGESLGINNKKCLTLEYGNIGRKGSYGRKSLCLRCCNFAEY